MKKMSLAIISKSNSAGGGASRVAEDINRIFKKNGHVVSHYASWSTEKFKNIKSLYGPKIIKGIIRRLHGISRRIGFAEVIPFEFLSVFCSNIKKYDIIHVHDTTSCLSPFTLYFLAKIKPVVWTIHDCSPFTGGCLYPHVYKCEKYKSGCGKCPGNYEWPLGGFFDFTKMMFKIKRWVLKNSNIKLVTPSEWMADFVESQGFKRPEVISNIVDKEIFYKKENISQIKNKLKIPENRLIIVSSSGNINDERKGLKDVINIAKNISDINPLLILIGKKDKKINNSIIDGVETIFTDYIEDKNLLSDYLNISDIYLFCSKADNQPLSILESLACGTPVYGLPTGGVKELILNGFNGYVDRNINNVSLKIKDDFKNGKIMEMKNSNLLKFSEEEFYDKHYKLYEKCIL